MANKKRKDLDSKIISIVGCVILIVFAFGILGVATSGFKNWDTHAWFKKGTVEVPTAETTDLKPLCKGFYEYKGNVFLRYEDSEGKVSFHEATLKSHTFNINVNKEISGGLIDGYAAIFDEEETQMLFFSPDDEMEVSYSGFYNDREVTNKKLTFVRGYFHNSNYNGSVGWSEDENFESFCGLIFGKTDVWGMPGITFGFYSLAPCQVVFTVNYYEVKDLPKDFDYAVWLNLPIDIENTESEVQ